MEFCGSGSDHILRMTSFYPSLRFVAVLLLLLCATLVSPPCYVRCANQQSFPEPPNDLTRIYYLSGPNQILPLPFEAGLVSLNVFVPAREDRITQVRIKGAMAETVLTNDNLRFYAYVADKMDPPPHQLVRLTNRRSNRELKISVIKGRKGYAPFDDDTLKLQHRVLERLRVQVAPGRIIFVNYMELRPARALPPGEYAIIGDSLADMATFRIK